MTTFIRAFASWSLVLYGTAAAGQPAVVRPAETEHVWVVFKTHFDIGYTESIAQVLAKYRGPMIDNAMAVIAKNRQSPTGQRFSWTVPGWPLTRIIDGQQTADRRAKVIEALKEGSLAVHALPFSLHTESLDLEDLVRGLHFSAKIARDVGKPLPIGGKMTDPPCHSWVLPTLLHHAGIRFLHMGGNPCAQGMRLPPLFWWEGPDGSRILCAYVHEYGTPPVPTGNDWPAKNYLAMVMTGDNQGPPTVEEVEKIRRTIAAQLPKAKVTFGTLDDFAKAIEEEKPELEVIRRDMPDTWIHGVMSNPIESGTVRRVRPLEPALETLDTQLRAWGEAPAPLGRQLAEAYEQSVMYGEHTWGPGVWQVGSHYGDEWKKLLAKGHYNSFLQQFVDKGDEARKVDAIVSPGLADRLDLLARSVKSEGPRVVVYNPLPWTRSGIVEISGRPGQRFLAKDVPGSGYRTYPMGNEQPTANDVSASSLDTPFYKIAFDLKRGGIASLVEKSTGRELVDQSSPYALGQFLHERFSWNEVEAFTRDYVVPIEFNGNPSWLNLNEYGKPGMPSPDRSPYAAITPGAWTLVIKRDVAADTVIFTAGDTKGLAKGYTLTFAFPRHEAAVEVQWRVEDKTPDPIPEGGWLCFPFAIQQPQFVLGRLGGPIDPAKDLVPGSNRFLGCVSTGVAITGADQAGAGLCPLDSPLVSLDQPGLWKWSLDFIPKRPAVFVNLYNNMYNTNFRLWQEGSWSSRVSFWPLPKGSDAVEDLAEKAWEARLPLLATVSRGPAGTLPLSQTGLALSRRGVLVTAFGNDPDGSAGTLLRVWEQGGRAGDLTVTLPHGLKATHAAPVNLRGEPTGKAMAIVDGTFTFPLPAFAPASFVLTDR